MKKFFAVLAILLAVLSCVEAASDHKVSFETTIGFGDLLGNLVINSLGMYNTDGFKITSSAFGNYYTTKLPKSKQNPSSFYLLLPRFSAYFSPSHGLSTQLDLITSADEYGERESEFNLFLGYSYRHSLSPKLSLSLAPGISYIIHLTEKSDPPINTSEATLGLIMYADLRFEVNSWFYISAGLMNRTAFLLFQKLGDKSYNKSFFQNTFSLPHLCMGFKF